MGLSLIVDDDITNTVLFYKNINENDHLIAPQSKGNQKCEDWKKRQTGMMLDTVILLWTLYYTKH